MMMVLPSASVVETSLLVVIILHREKPKIFLKISLKVGQKTLRIETYDKKLVRSINTMLEHIRVRKFILLLIET